MKQREIFSFALQPASILLGSSEAGARVLLEVERDGKLLRSEWLTLGANEQRWLPLASGPATARGPLYVHTTQVRDNRLYRHDATVQVAERPQPLRLAIATFRDRLQPGQKETWRVSVRQANGQPAEAELLATLYDQSLDVFRPHSFAGLEFGQGYYPARFGWMGEFGELSSGGLADNVIPDDIPPVEYPELNTWNERENDRAYDGYSSGGQPRRRTLAGRVAGVQLSEAVVMNS